MREPTEDHIAADFARDRYTVKQQPSRQPWDYGQVAQSCIGLFFVAAGCACALALAYGLGMLGQ